MIRISNRQRKTAVDQGWLRRQGEFLLNLSGLSGAELSLLLTSDPLIRSLNREYRGVDRPTDVLAFPQTEHPDERMDSSRLPRLLGDVVISVETARRRAEDAGERLEDEVRRLLVHGFLHLIGYDHERGPRDAARMRRRERTLIGRLHAAEALD